jgi:putative CocE/NonD family hydrolase
MRLPLRSIVTASLVILAGAPGCALRSWPLTSKVAWPTAPDPTSPYKLRADFDQRVKMRDGVELSADVYRPDAAGRFPVILMRDPYNKGQMSKFWSDQIKYYVRHGYVCVCQDVRGRGESDGRFTPWHQEGPDGYDSVEWCAAQPWSSGKVGMLGASYPAYAAWLAAAQTPPHLAAMVVIASPSDPFVENPTGLPSPMMINWYHAVAGRTMQDADILDWTELFKHQPLYTLDEAAGRPNAYWKAVIDHAQLDEWWEPCRYQNKFARIRVPVLHVSGWYDDEQIGTPLNYIGMTTRGPGEVRRVQRLLIGPWPHRFNRETKVGSVEFGPTAVIDFSVYAAHWFDHWLKGIDNGVTAEPPVRIFVMSGEGWRDEQEWPLARTAWTRYYLHSGGHANSTRGDGALSTEVPREEPPDEYVSDPENPVPLITEPSFAQVGGPDDYRPVEARDDVLVYSTPVLRSDVEVCGPIRVKLYAASSTPDTDFVARLIDVRPDGFAQRLCDGLVRARFRQGMDKSSFIEPGRVYEYDIDCWNTCQVFKRGHRIRIEITSSAFPAFDVNPNTGGPLGRTVGGVRATQRILHDREHPSHVVLPIVSPERSVN